MGSGALAQTVRPWPLPKGVEGQAWIMGSRYAPFPDSLRRGTPRVYEGKTYAWQEHYNDSSVLVFVPSYMNPAESCAFVHWFHGWLNNIDSSVK
ncbi:MAG: hypothetical protein MUF29_06235, partial [Chitinophagaceae bacterium]|nr:hypothetical protein [Chitinophagaceae bacterium]